MRETTVQIMSFKLFSGTYCVNSEIIISLKLLIVSPDESWGYLGFSTVTLPLQRFPFGRDNLKIF